MHRRRALAYRAPNTTRSRALQPRAAVGQLRPATRSPSAKIAPNAAINARELAAAVADGIHPLQIFEPKRLR
eukprot:973134-Pyramimonas_sp.AAC.1